MAEDIYHPSTFRPRTYFDAVELFRRGKDDPRRYLERCLEVIEQREPVVKAWVVLNEEGAREAADASAARWRDGRPISPIDGMPIGIKDLIETKDLPTQMGCAAFEGNFPKRDSACVRALRDAGAIVLGKVVTTELGGTHPGPTTNPFDRRRTPGGSSSGSGASVGAGMVPVSIGTQVGGSVIRPSSFCANWALKPTYGALNRGERQGYSQSHIGVHAGCAEDMWQVAIEMVRRGGGDPGHPGLFGPAEPPSPVRPQQLIVIETEGWQRLDSASRDAFERMLDKVSGQGIRLLRRSESSLVEAFEQSIAAATALTRDICAYEVRWSLENIAEHPGGLSSRALAQLDHARSLSLDDFRDRLMARDDIRRRMAQLAPLGDALITLSSPGPAPIADIEAPRPTGDAAFNYPASLLGAPAINVPLLSVDGMPLGVQLVGQPHTDSRLTGIARWLSERVSALSADNGDGVKQ